MSHTGQSVVVVIPVCLCTIGWEGCSIYVQVQYVMKILQGNALRQHTHTTMTVVNKDLLELSIN